MALGFVACFGLSSCTALTSTKDASDTAQLHDARMRMRHGQLQQVSGTNYGTTAVMASEYPATSVPANSNTTVSNQPVQVPTSGNSTMSQMPDAYARPHPAPTAGN
jgi:hypothetical protein